MEKTTRAELGSAQLSIDKKSRENGNMVKYQRTHSTGKNKQSACRPGEGGG